MLLLPIKLSSASGNQRKDPRWDWAAKCWMGSCQTIRPKGGALRRTFPKNSATKMTRLDIPFPEPNTSPLMGFYWLKINNELLIPGDVSKRRISQINALQQRYQSRVPSSFLSYLPFYLLLPWGFIVWLVLRNFDWQWSSALEHSNHLERFVLCVFNMDIWTPFLKCLFNWPGMVEASIIF